MPVRYIDVTATSGLFVAATRAYGNIAIVGKGCPGTKASDPAEFTDPAAAVTAYPATRTVSDAVLNSTTTVTSATAAFAAGDAGRPVTGPGIADKTTIASVTSATEIVLSAAATETKTNVTLTFGVKDGENPLTDLAAAIGTAFAQTPPPTLVWGVQVDHDNPDFTTGLAAAASLNAQIVVLAGTSLNTANQAAIQALATHVTTVSSSGGDGKERIGVAMLDSTLSATSAAALNTGTVKSERMFLIAHKSADDVAAAAAGVIAGYEPQISMLLKPIRINMTGAFSDAEIDTLDAAAINWVTSPVLIPGQSLFLGEGYTANPSLNKKYIDIVRTIDDISFRIKAELIQAIGNLRLSRPGLRAVTTLVGAVLSPLVSADVIEAFTVYIPLLVLLDKDPATLSATELTQIQSAQANRSLDMTVSVVYAGAIHRLHIDLDFQ